MSTSTEATTRFFPGPTWTSHLFIDDEVMDDQFKHHVEMMLYGMADLGECLEVARQILPGDEESWIRAWSDMAQRVDERAQAADRKGKVVSAASANRRRDAVRLARRAAVGAAIDCRSSDGTIVKLCGTCA